MLKKTILRVLSFVLVLVMLTSFAVACNKDTGNSGNNGQQNEGGNTDNGSYKPDDPNGGGEVITDADPVKVLDGLPDQDMQGYEFTVLCRENTVFLREASADNDTGDQVDQAVYDRNFYVEDRYNCFLMTAPVTESPESTLTSTYNKSVSVGENAYQLALGHMMYTASECLNGTMLNLKILPSVDLKKDYWHQSMNDAATINNKIFFTASDYCTYSTYYTYVMTFNMDACQERGIDFEIAGGEVPGKHIKRELIEKYHLAPEVFIGKVNTWEYLSENTGKILFAAGVGLVILEAGYLNYPCLCCSESKGRHYSFVTLDNVRYFDNFTISGHSPVVQKNACEFEMVPGDWERYRLRDYVIGNRDLAVCVKKYIDVISRDR